MFRMGKAVQMPPKIGGSIGSEASLARRIRYERERLGMKPIALAKRMTDIGCPMNQSAIWKIENGDPPRRITVDELVGFSRVFGVPVDDLLLAPEVAADDRMRELLMDLRAANAKRSDVLVEIVEHVRRHPRAESVLEEHLTEDDRLAIRAMAWEAGQKILGTDFAKGIKVEDMAAIAGIDAPPAPTPIQRKGKARGKHREAP